jgi:hypothetical protein
MRNQLIAVEVGTAVFSRANMTCVRERALRFFEEACEAARAAGLDREDMEHMVDYECSRPVGDVPQEIAGVQLTLFALSNVLGIDAEHETEKEIIRLLQNIDKLRAKHATKPELLRAV